MSIYTHLWSLKTYAWKTSSDTWGIPAFFGVNKHSLVVGRELCTIWTAESEVGSGRLGLQRINFNRHVSVTISLVDKVHSLLGSVQFSFTLAMSKQSILKMLSSWMDCQPERWDEARSILHPLSSNACSVKWFVHHILCRLVACKLLIAMK